MSPEKAGPRLQAIQDVEAAKKAAEADQLPSYVEAAKSVDNFLDKLDDMLAAPGETVVHAHHRTLSARAVPTVLNCVFPAFKHAS